MASIPSPASPRSISSSSSTNERSMFHSSAAAPPPPPPPPPPLSYADHGLLSALCYSSVTPAANGADVFYDANGCSYPPPPSLLSSSPSYPSSHPSYYLHRSSSSHSLPVPQHHRIPDHLNSAAFFASSSSPPTQHHHLPPVSALSSSPSSSSCEFVDFNSGPMRRVFSTGDLQGTNGQQPSAENYNQDGGAIGGRVGRYSAEERKERIERYRSKRNQRNFHKKITYACRKTLADSRPRVRGRFARNGETETEAEAEVETDAAASGFDYYNYSIYEQAPSYGGVGCCSDGGGSLVRQMQPAFPAEEEDEFPYYDEVLLSNFADVFSMNLL